MEAAMANNNNRTNAMTVGTSNADTDNNSSTEAVGLEAAMVVEESTENPSTIEET